MKIYTKVIINMETLETEETEWFEYEGELALCGGSDSEVTHTQSPEQQAIYRMISPILQQGLNQGGWPISAPPDPRDEIPSMQGVMSGVPMYDIPQAQQPDQQWYGNLSPELVAGGQQPYLDAASQLNEYMGGRGQLGSPRGGFSGSFGAGAGEIYGDMARDVPRNLWDMGAQGRQNMWGAQLGRNQQDYQNQLQESMADFGRYGQAFEGGMNRWQQSQNIYGGIPGMLGGTYGQPVVDPGSPDQTGQIAGTIAQMAMMYAMGGCDIRLKKNINKVGTYKGFDVIEFDYLWDSGRRTGLIAQQVQKRKPEAVGKLPNGYLYINYALV